MALTFRAFFQGLADSAPAIVQTIYQYRQDEIKNMFQERQMALEERKGAQYGEYMAVASEQARAGTEQTRMTTEEMKKLFPLDLAIKEAEKKTADYTLSLQEANKDASVNKYGSLAGAAEAVITAKEQAARDAHNEVVAKINLWDTQTATAVAQQKYMELQAKQEKSKLTFDLVNLYRGCAKSPQMQKMLDKAAQENWSQKGGADPEGIMTFIRDHADEFVTPDEKAIALAGLQPLYEASKINMQLRANTEQRLDNLKLSGDPKLIKSYWQTLNINPKEANIVDPNDPNKRTLEQIQREMVIEMAHPEDILTKRAKFYQSVIDNPMTWGFTKEPTPLDLYNSQYNGANSMGTSKTTKQQSGSNPYLPEGVTGGFDAAGIQNPPIKKAFKSLTKPSTYPQY